MLGENNRLQRRFPILKNQHAAGKPSVQLAASLLFQESQPVYRIFIHFGLTIFSISEQLQFS